MRKPSSMDEYVYSMDDAGLCLQNKKEKRLKRMVHILIVLVLVQALASVILLVALGLRGQQPQHEQGMKLNESQSAEISQLQQQQPTDLAIPSVMLTAPHGQKTDGKYLLWEDATGIAYHHGGFSYSSGNLTVTRKGLYSIFLQITYSKSCDKKCPPIYLSHTVYSVSDAYPLDRPLLSAEEKMSGPTTDWSKTLYTAGLYFLEANTILHVTSTHPELISNSERLVFFGAYLLSEHATHR